MLVFPRKVKPFTTAKWGETPAVQIAGGPTLHELRLTTNLAPSDIERINFILNGDTIVTLTGEEARMLERYKKIYEVEDPEQPNYGTQVYHYVIPFADKSGKTLDGQGSSRLVTFPTDALTLEVRVREWPGGGTEPAIRLRAHARVSASEAQRLTIPRIRSINFDALVSGENVLNTIARGPALRRMHIRGDVSELKVLRDRLNVFEESRDGLEFELKRSGRAPQDGYYHFDPVASGFVRSEQFRTASDELEFVMQVGDPGTFRILLETLEAAAVSSAEAAA